MMTVLRLFNRNYPCWRTLHKAATICVLVSLLVGLIPPPAVRSFADATLPATLSETVVNAADALLPEAAMAHAAPVEVPVVASPAAPLAQVVSGSNVLTITKSVYTKVSRLAVGYGKAYTDRAVSFA